VLADSDSGGKEESGHHDGGDAPSKEEAETDEELYEPMMFAIVSLARCDEPGPSGLRQQQQQFQHQGLSSGLQFLTSGAMAMSTATPASASWWQI
jgi:hypothetical protein